MKFILWLICIVYPYPWCPRQTLPSPRYVIGPFPGRTTSKTLSLFFSINSSFFRISQLPDQNQQNRKQSWLHPLSFKITLKDASFHFSISSLGLYLSPECLLNLSNFYIPPYGKHFQIYKVHIPEKCIDWRHFYSCPSPLKTRPQVRVITL